MKTDKKWQGKCLFHRQKISSHIYLSTWAIANIAILSFTKYFFRWNQFLLLFSVIRSLHICHIINQSGYNQVPECWILCWEMLMLCSYMINVIIMCRYVLNIIILCSYVLNIMIFCSYFQNIIIFCSNVLNIIKWCSCVINIILGKGPKIKKARKYGFWPSRGGEGVTQNQILFQTSFFSVNLAIFSANLENSE